MRIAYDIETYPNCFTLSAAAIGLPVEWQFEISDRRNDSGAICEWVTMRQSIHAEMVGFNNVGFDYPVLHTLLQMRIATAASLYDKAQAIIHSQDSNRWMHQVFPSDRWLPQIDLFKIHHFDNKARATSLKVLEFNMRAENVSDLPFPVGTYLNSEQMDVLLRYNMHDVHQTVAFYHQTVPMIEFRQQLSARHGKDFTNHSDVKIGKEIFQIELDRAGVHCYDFGPDGRIPRQTKRPVIHLRDCVPSWVRFERPEFKAIRQHFMETSITETKGAFKLEATVDGMTFYYGTGGLHASVSNKVYESNDDWIIYDVDVTSLYPSIAIECGYFPEHLGPRFVDVYRRLREQRVGYKKGTPENAMLKLALNGVYGASGDQFSIFFDPLFTMRITITGQLVITMLAERLMGILGVELIQCNTDGITMFMHRSVMDRVKQVCAEWEALTKLCLESVQYRCMAIRDVNNYLAVTMDGKTKRKGAYEYDLDWHQNHSALVVPKVAKKVLVEGVTISDTVRSWPERMDFMLRVKVPRSSKLTYTDDEGEQQIQNTTRYYVAQEGGYLTKIMPPIKGNTEWRRIGVESGRKVCVCNNLADAVLPIDYDYYINEVEKLVLGMR